MTCFMIFATPSASLDTRSTSSLPHTARSSEVLPTSIPTYASEGVVICTISPYNLEQAHTSMDTASQATQLFGLFWMMDTAVVLRDGLGDLMTIGVPCPLLFIILMT